MKIFFGHYIFFILLYFHFLEAARIGGEERLLSIEELFDSDAEFWPKVLGKVKIRAKIEDSPLTDCIAESI